MKLLYSLFFIFILAIPRPAPAYVIDRIAAVVDDTVIAQSEVDGAAEAEAMRLGRSSPSPETRREALDSLINRVLLLSEARKFNIAEVSDEEVERAFESVRAGYGSDEEFQKALAEEELTVGELKRNLRDKLLVSKYVDRRIKFFVRVTLDEIRDYYEENRKEFGGKTFGEAHDEIQGLLVERETSKKLDEYLAELRTKSKIKVFEGQ